MKKIIIIQARIASARLPGKVLALIEGVPLFGHVVQRMRKSRYFDEINLATTMQSDDDPLVDYARKLDVGIYRGSNDDVLARYYYAARQFNGDIIARITSDDPFKDPVVLDKVMEKFMKGGYDYVSNTIEPSYPEGLDVEIFSQEALVRCHEQAHKGFEREHVTPYIWMNPDKFSICNVKCEKDYSHMRWTVDTKDDLFFAREIYKRLYRSNHIFRMESIIELLENDSAFMALMPRIRRNEGLQISMEKK